MLVLHALDIMIFLDADECLSTNCATHATCIDTIGSYYCACEYGFVKDGNVCIGMFP